jgi:hypothetical protein
LQAVGWGRPQESLILYKSSILSAIIPLVACIPHGLQQPFLFDPTAFQASFDPASHIASETDFFPASIPAHERTRKSQKQTEENNCSRFSTIQFCGRNARKINLEKKSER